MSRPLADDSDEKWSMKEHTSVKHEILRKYLVPWTRIVSSTNPRIHYFDGFAGRGVYEDGEKGSPIHAMEVAHENAEQFEEFLCNFIEYDDSNFQDLQRVVAEKKGEVTDKVRVECTNEAFADVANDLLDTVESRMIPTFVFVDPFGYKGVDFETIARFLKFQNTGIELFITFMVRDIRRFISDEGHSDSISDILGTDAWKDLRGQSDIEEDILKIYRDQLKKEGGVEYAWPFEMKMPERSETVYYLIHATNHFKGFRVMKQVMYNTGAEDQMAYLGPDHYKYDGNQAKLYDMSDSSDTRITELQDLLQSRFDGERLTFLEVLKETYHETNLIDTHYREAIQGLQDRHEVTIENRPNQGGTENGLDDGDIVDFSRKYAELTDYF